MSAANPEYWYDLIEADAELKQFFRDCYWKRICRLCGAFLGNVSNWLEHNVDHHMDDPNVHKVSYVP